jgi:hypothetical protein
MTSVVEVAIDAWISPIQVDHRQLARAYTIDGHIRTFVRRSIASPLTYAGLYKHAHLHLLPSHQLRYLLAKEQQEL